MLFALVQSSYLANFGRDLTRISIGAWHYTAVEGKDGFGGPYKFVRFLHRLKNNFFNLSTPSAFL